MNVVKVEKVSKVKVSASILSADFANLESEVIRLEKAGVDMLHFDVMDGHFVPNITMGPDLIKSVRKHSNLIFDTHLMIEHPDKYIEHFAQAGSDIITVHTESSIHLNRTVSLIKNLGKKAGVSLIPSTSEMELEYILPHVDLVLVMTVNPGFAGQKFIENCIPKIANIRAMAQKLNPSLEIAVDGGINAETGKKCVESGANILVSASYLFNGDLASNLNNLKLLG